MDSRSLHTAARRHLAACHDDVVRHGESMGVRSPHGRYRVEHERAFPLDVLAAEIPHEVERLDPDDLPEPRALAAALTAAAFRAPTHGTDRVAVAAEEAERLLFREAVRDWSTSDEPVAPLPYRRVLSVEEFSLWTDRLVSRWGLRDQVWYPIVDDPPADVLVLRVEAMWDGPGEELVLRALRGLGSGRVVELDEGNRSDGRVIDLDLFVPWYEGVEKVWCDETLDWICFASHESTVAFGGTLADALIASWPDIDRWRCTGWNR
ncbi:hypothetical protein GCM10022243_36870 [Saccharothrix violaceirubra]|uniref:Uncharacterized protein n=1 Tax=Saccharothrix violaceirubra TaxID=413306 RepID=A0A7W7T4G5_9PSEU|nr:hypothetical protein [Saccharothrix violaceirubra]MBB4966398.1 hypothetical protein [Saccharothrix violaceirubra]